MRALIFGVTLLALWCAAFMARAADVPAVSLFFTPDEIKSIETPPDVKKPAPAAVALPDLHLGAVIYYSPSDWAVWLEGERWTPATHRDNLVITDVEPDEVHLSWRPSPDVAPREILLRPYQTYRAMTGSVVEGMQ